MMNGLAPGQAGTKSDQMEANRKRSNLGGCNQLVGFVINKQ